MIVQYINVNILSIIVAVMFLILVIQMIMIIKLQKRYTSFIKKLGNGNDIEEMLKVYMNSVRNIEKENEEIKEYCQKLDYDVSTSLQKVGLVRYNAFKNVGSDLSFAIALLDRNNNGVVINGIYGAESSNIYAKPIKNNKSTYQLSDEEEYAIEIAEQNKMFISKNRK